MKVVGAGGNAPLVCFRRLFFDNGFTDHRPERHPKEMVAGPGNAPGRQGYEPRVGSSRPASLLHDIKLVATAGLAPAFSCFQGTRLDYFALVAVKEKVEPRGNAPRPAACKAAVLLLSLRPRKIFKDGTPPWCCPRQVGIWNPNCTLVRGMHWRPRLAIAESYEIRLHR